MDELGQIKASSVSRETPTWRWVTDRGLRIASGDATLAMYRRLCDANLSEINEMVPADGSLLLVMKPGVALPAVLSDILNEEQGRQAAAPGTKQHEIAVTFDGEDLRFVAAQTGLSVPDLIRRLCATVFSVKFLGFQPGFAYLEGLPEALHLARRNTPRTRVPAGSVALGGPYCGIYPAEGPGGWHLVGRTEAILFNPAARPPARLQPGDTVRLVPA